MNDEREIHKGDEVSFYMAKNKRSVHGDLCFTSNNQLARCTCNSRCSLSPLFILCIILVSLVHFSRTGALRARLVRLVQPAKVETVQVNCYMLGTN